MKKQLLFWILPLMLGACVSDQERRESMYRYEQTMRNQCDQTMGFAPGTQNYMDCRMHYDEYLKAVGYDTSYMTFYKAQNIQNKIDTLNSKCSRYWGKEGISGNYLWRCIQQLSQQEMAQAKHEKELKEQEEMLSRSISAGQTEAYENARLQSRIDAERERVARTTGKNPKKIYCSTYTKSNGYIQVKCK